MAIRQSRGRWVADITDVNGRRHRPSFKEREQAETWQLEAELATRKGEPVPLPNQPNTQVKQRRQNTLSDAVDSCYAMVWKRQKDGDGSLSRAESAMDILGPNRSIDSIERSDLMALQQHLLDDGMSEGTVNRYCAAVSRVLTHAVDRGWLKQKPRVSKLTENGQRVRCLTTDEEQEMYVWCQEQDEIMFCMLIVFLIDTGCRMGEARAIEWTDINLKDRTVHLPETKSGYPRTIPLTDRVADLLTQLRDSMKDSLPDGPWAIEAARWDVNRKWNRMREALGRADEADFVPHVLRHTFCSRLSGLGVDLNRIKELAGHRNIKTTLIYAHLNQTHLRGAISQLSQSLTTTTTTKGN